MGSTVYSDSHSSQQSVLYQSLLEPITMATQQVCMCERSHLARLCTLNAYAAKKDGPLAPRSWSQGRIFTQMKSLFLPLEKKFNFVF